MIILEGTIEGTIFDETSPIDAESHSASIPHIKNASKGLKRA